MRRGTATAGTSRASSGAGDAAPRWLYDNMKIFERFLWLTLACALLVAGVEVFGTDATEYSFSPDTLEIRYRSVNADGITLWPGRYHKHESRVIDYLVENGYVTPIQSKSPRWIGMGCFSPKWRDGQGPLTYVFSWGQDNTIAWCEADPERARLFWSTVFPLLRSDNEREVRLGEGIARFGVRRDISTQELQQFIDSMLADAGVANTAALRPGQGP